MVVAAIEANQDWLKLTKALQEAFWGRGEDIGDTEIRRSIATAAGFDAAVLDDLGQGEAVQARRTSSYETAKAAGVFGLPTFLYEGELYWGQDSLPFLERHLKGEKLVA
jgi:2-hydroxychromene-2-carboxylate isomerase